MTDPGFGRRRGTDPKGGGASLIITARPGNIYVRTTGGYVFTGVCLFRGGGGSQVSDFRGGGVPGLRFSGRVPGLRFSGGEDVPGLRFFGGGSQVSDFQGGRVPGLKFFGGVPGLRFLGGGYPVSVKGKIFDT